MGSGSRAQAGLNAALARVHPEEVPKAQRTCVCLSVDPYKTPKEPSSQGGNKTTLRSAEEVGKQRSGAPLWPQISELQCAVKYFLALTCPA